MAMPSGLVARAAVGAESIDQPTTGRDQTSGTTRQEILPSLVRCSVMSVTQSWSGWVRVKRRSTRSAAVAMPGGRKRTRRLGMALKSGALHERGDRVVPDDDAASEHEFRRAHVTLGRRRVTRRGSR